MVKWVKINTILSILITFINYFNHWAQFIFDCSFHEEPFCKVEKTFTKKIEYLKITQNFNTVRCATLAK